MIGRNFREISDAYSELASYQEAGYPLLQALERMLGQRRGNPARLIGELIARIRAGRSLHRAMAEASLPPMDIAIVRVSEESGKLPDGLRMLSRDYRERHEQERLLRYAILKPGLLVLATLVFGEIPSWASGETSLGVSLARIGVRIGLLTAIVGLGWKIFRNKSRRISPWVPVIGPLMQARTMERLFTCLRMAVTSGCEMRGSLELAEFAVRHDPEYAKALRAVYQNFERFGVSEAFTETGRFRPSQLDLLRVGEATGKLEESLAKICSDLQQEIATAVKVLDEWIPKIIYGLAMAYAAYRVLGFYTGHMSTLDHIGE